MKISMTYPQNHWKYLPSQIFLMLILHWILIHSNIRRLIDQKIHHQTYQGTSDLLIKIGKFRNYLQIMVISGQGFKILLLCIKRYKVKSLQDYIGILTQLSNRISTWIMLSFYYWSILRSKSTIDVELFEKHMVAWPLIIMFSLYSILVERQKIWHLDFKLNWLPNLMKIETYYNIIL